MTDIAPNKSIDIQKELGDLAQYKYHPNGILKHTFNRLKDITDGRVELSDPSNPFTYLIETSCLNTGFAIQEMVLLTRKLYPKLANNEDDLYLHMSDVDYLDRFSKPSEAKVTFNILFSDFKTKAWKDPYSGDYVHTIPRNYQVQVDTYVYTLTAPIVIRLTETGIIDIKIDGAKNDDLFELDSGFVNFEMWSVNQAEEYISFSVKMPEVYLEETEIPVEKSKSFKGHLNFKSDRKYYYTKVYHFRNEAWEEIKTTHGKGIYDINEVTCELKINQLDRKVSYYIPPVYVNNGMLGSKVKFVIYTTMGEVNLNFSDFKISDFESSYNEIFPETDLDETTKSLNVIAKTVFIEGRVIGGSGPKTFSKLKKDLINNNLGRNNKPITGMQIDSFASANGMTLVKNVDTLTNRIFLLEAEISETSTRYGSSKISLDLMDFKSSIGEMTTDKNKIIRISETATLIPAGTVFEHTPGGIKLLTEDEATLLKSLSGNSLTNEVNNKRYLELFYTYVLDTAGNSVRLRAYDLEKPSVARINFKDYNHTTRVGVNTEETNLVKIETGFQLDILTNLTKYDSTISETNVTPYLAYSDEGGAVFYLEGRLLTVSGEKPIYRFTIDSDFYVSDKNEITITNFRDRNYSFLPIDIPLTSKLNLLYVTNKIPAGFEASKLDTLIEGSFILPNRAVVTQEELSVKLGDYLEFLYSRVYSSTGVDEYERYEEDVPARYNRTIYAADNTVLHRRNDILLDEEGEPIIQHQRGDIVVGEDGFPIFSHRQDTQRYLKLLFMDYKSSLAEDNETIDHREYVRSHLTSLVTDKVASIQKRLLENTQAFLTVPSNLDDILIEYDGRRGYINASQGFKITVYVTNRYYNDRDARRGVELMLKEELSDYLSKNRVLSKSVIVSRMLEKTSEYTEGLNIDQFTELNANYIELPNEGDRITFNKVLSIEPEGYVTRDDVVVTFVKVGVN